MVRTLYLLISLRRPDKFAVDADTMLTSVKEKKVGKMAIKKCSNPNCKSQFQDEKYGPGKRVMNPCKEGHRCTVCTTEVKK